MYDVIKQIISRTPKKYFVGVAVAAAFAIVPMGIRSSSAAFGPDRPVVDFNTPANGTNQPTFNSMTNVPNGVGDEREFATGVTVGTDGQWTDRSKVKPGDEVMMRVWVHNDAFPGLNDEPGQPGIARNTKFRVKMPTTSNTSQQLTAYISATNAVPAEVFDTYDVFADQPFALSYIDDSASFTNEAHPNGIKLDDANLLTTGSLLGYQQLDGNFPGCFEYSGWIYLKFKVGSTELETDKKVRKEGQTANTDFKENVTAKPGETVEWRVVVNNKTGAQADNVTIVDQLPDFLTFVPGSAKVVNANFPDGKVFDTGELQAGNKQVNVNIGNYTAGSNAYILFKTKIDASDKVTCGQLTITNTAFVKKEGDAQSKADTASVTIDNKCVTAAETKCTSLAVTEVSRTKREFTAKADVSGATISSYTFEVTDKDNKVVSTQKVESTAKEAKSTFESDKAGNYKVKVTVATSNGNLTSEQCAASFEIKTAPAQPVAECRDIEIINVTGKARTIRVKVLATADGGAKIKNYRYDFGDQSTALLSDQNPSPEHTYAADGEYIVRVQTNFEVNGAEKVDKDERCTEVVKINTVVQTARMIPSTGAESLLGAFAGVSALGAAVHFATGRRRNS